MQKVGSHCKWIAKCSCVYHVPLWLSCALSPHTAFYHQNWLVTSLLPHNIQPCNSYTFVSCHNICITFSFWFNDNWDLSVNKISVRQCQSFYFRGQYLDAPKDLNILKFYKLLNPRELPILSKCFVVLSSSNLRVLNFFMWDSLSGLSTVYI